MVILLISQASDLDVLLANLLESSPKEVAHHLAISALNRAPSSPTVESLRAEALKIVGADTTLPEHFDDAAGEM